ncbi:MAG: SufE family protein [Rickettsiales bacterium]|jgi:cysteine desulfuration protein SufE|nr:SufE family protein [Rickettsiales bacterium]
MTFEEIKVILSQITDPADRLEFVMDIGKALPGIPPDVIGTEIKGCASKVEIYKDKNNNYYGAADSSLVRGVLAIILSMVQGKARAAIIQINPMQKFENLNLGLGAGRMNGVNGIIEFLEKE